uniref:Transmembrane protein n=1 Tax=Plectus sambesii TaxID=2011161 RepID=A0A914UV15_9BILA
MKACTSLANHRRMIGEKCAFHWHAQSARKCDAIPRVAVVFGMPYDNGRVPHNCLYSREHNHIGSAEAMTAENECYPMLPTSSSTLQTPVERDLSSSEAHYDSHLLVQRDPLSNGCVMPPRALTDRLRPTLRCLQVCGYFAASLSNSLLTGPRQTSSGGFRTWIWRDLGWRLYVLFFITINLFLCTHTVALTKTYNDAFGILHAFTVTAIITGIKPLINVLGMVVFAILAGRHRHLLRQLNRVNQDFGASFGCEPNFLLMNAKFIMAMILVAMIIGPLRLFEFIMTGNELGTSLLTDLSLVLVPMISVWGTLPLFYFLLIEGLVGFYCVELRRQLHAPPGQRRHSLKFFYKKFVDICDLQGAAGNIFGPWIMCSLGWSLFTLCLTIYFATQAKTFADLPPEFKQIMTAEEIAKARLMLYFNIGWSILQIIIAFFYILIICYVGTTINEGTRLIMRAVLSTMPDDDCDSERFQVTCFMYKMQTQYSWGVTVWRAFPIERGVFFTLFSIIVTYAVLLMKFRDGAPPVGIKFGEQMSIDAAAAAEGNHTLVSANDTEEVVNTIL